MKVTTTYDLPDDDYSYRCSYHSARAFNTIEELCAQIRGHLKHGVGGHQQALERVYRELVDLVDLVQP